MFSNSFILPLPTSHKAVSASACISASSRREKKNGETKKSGRNVWVAAVASHHQGQREETTKKSSNGGGVVVVLAPSPWMPEHNPAPPPRLGPVCTCTCTERAINAAVAARRWRYFAEYFPTCLFNCRGNVHKVPDAGDALERGDGGNAQTVGW